MPLLPRGTLLPLLLLLTVTSLYPQRQRVRSGSSDPSPACSSVLLGDIYVKTGNPASIPTAVWTCTQTGASTYSWQRVSHKTQATAPATCSQGDLWFDSDATAGQNLFGCTSTNTWTLVSGGGGGDVTGPASSVSGNLPSFNGTTGKLLQDSGTKASDFATAAHDHDATYAVIAKGVTNGDSHDHAGGDGGAIPLTSGVTGTLPLANGGSNQASWTAGRCVQVNSGGTALESASAACGSGSGSTYVAGPSGVITINTTPDPDEIDIDTAVLPRKATSETIAGLWTFSLGGILTPMALPTCNAGNTGRIVSDTGDSNKFKFCDGSSWTALGASSSTLTQRASWTTGCQQGVAGTSLSMPSTNYPTATCVAGTNTIYGVMSFAENGAAAAQSVQGMLPIPTGWTGDVDADVVWRTSAITGSVVWQLQTTCVADAETGDPSFNAAQEFAADVAKGTTLQWNNVTQLTPVTMTGCAAGETLIFKLLRDATHASDDLAAAAELIRFTLTYRRSL